MSFSGITFESEQRPLVDVLLSVHPKAKDKCIDKASGVHAV